MDQSGEKFEEKVIQVSRVSKKTTGGNFKYLKRSE